MSQDIGLACNEPVSFPREIGVGLRYSLLRSGVIVNKLDLTAAIKHAAIALVNTFFNLCSYFLADVTLKQIF